MIYLDTSALVKRYVKEKGSETIGSLFKSEEYLITAKMAYAEALLIRSSTNKEVAFVCSDKNLLAASSRENFTVLNPEEAPWISNPYPCLCL